MKKITITPVTPATAGVTVILSDFEKVEGGVGGWETLDRPRRTAAAGWVGLPEKTLTLPVTADGVERAGIGRDDAAHVKLILDRIDGWALPAAATGEPTILKVTGVPRVPSTERWVIQAIDRGEYIANAAGTIVQADLTLTLLAYREATLVKGPAAKARSKKPKAGSKKPKKKLKPKKKKK